MSDPKEIVGSMKPSLHLIPLNALIHEAMALQDGVSKYGEFNWRYGDAVSVHTYIAASLRHILLYYHCREDLAKDSGVHHLGHARASLGILLDAIENCHVVDDRPPPSTASSVMDDWTEVSKVKSRKADPDQR